MAEEPPPPSEPSPSVSSSVATSVESAVESVRGAADTAASAVDEAISVTARGVVQAASAAQGLASCGLTQAQVIVDDAKAHGHRGLMQYKEYEDYAFSSLRNGIEWGLANPYVAYPVAGASALLILPVTRNLLWRMTVGRWRTPESVVRHAEGQVAALRPQVEDFGKQALKLQERLANAEEEFVRGRQKLRATRQELQRLSSVVGRTERTAASTLHELRGVRHAETAVPLRAEAATLLAQLRSQRATLDRSVYRIVAQDV